MAATASADTTVPLPPLPPETLDVIARHTLRSRLPSLRLACSQFAFAADPCVTLSVKADQWPHAPPAVGSRLQHVQCMSAVPSSPAHWHQLFQLSAQLPKLSHLRLPHPSSCSGSNDPPPTMPTFSAASSASLTRLDLATAGSTLSRLQPPEGVQLAGLKAASFDAVYGLWRIAGFAPKLEQLYCDRLTLYNGHDDDKFLPACTDYAGTAFVMSYRHTSQPPSGVLASRFSKAFPNLQVLTNAPAFYTLKMQGQGQPNHVDDMDSADVLQHCTSLRAIKSLGSLARCSLQQLQQLTQLTRLSLHSPWEVETAGFEGVGQLTQLQHVRLTCSERSGGYSGLKLFSQLAQQLAALPKLQTLVLPADLLTEHWLSALWHRDYLLEVASSSSLTRLEFFKAWHEAEEYWDALADGLDTFRAAVDAEFEKKARQQQQQGQAQQGQQGQQQGQAQPSGRKLHIPEQCGEQRHNSYREEGNWRQAYDGSQGVWGIYGAAGEW